MTDTSRNQQTHSGSNDDVPDTLYHYTSQEGLCGIVQTKQIWATQIPYLNDSREFAYAITFAVAAIKWERKSFSNYEFLLRRIIDELRRTEKQLPTSEIPIFVASFSRKGDLLSQWRGYCPNANGYSLGFDFARLYAIAKYEGYTLAKCLYRQTDQVRRIKETIEETINYYESQRLQPIGTSSGVSPTSLFMSKLLEIAPTLKDGSFEEESEWRLIVRLPSSAAVNFRPGRSLLIPYTKLKLADETGCLPLTKIYVGPTPHDLLSAQSVRKVLQVSGIAHCRVENSSIPYVAW